VPASFEDQLGIIDELLRQVARMERAERRTGASRRPGGYERELRLAGLAQHIAQAYTIMEGVLAFVARRMDCVPVTGGDWHKELIRRVSQPFERPARPTLISAPLASDLRELCEFRHVVRNIYPTHLDEARVRENLERLIRAARSLGTEARAFAVVVQTAGKPKRRRIR
jgi:hypothetical protein